MNIETLLFMTACSILVTFSVTKFFHWLFVTHPIKLSIHDLEEDIHEANRMLGKFNARNRSDTHYTDTIDICGEEITRLHIELGKLVITYNKNETLFASIRTWLKEK